MHFIAAEPKAPISDGCSKQNGKLSFGSERGEASGSTGYPNLTIEPRYIPDQPPVPLPTCE